MNNEYLRRLSIADRRRMKVPFLASLLLLLPVLSASQSSKPNIVLLFADDVSVHACLKILGSMQGQLDSKQFHGSKHNNTLLWYPICKFI